MRAELSLLHTKLQTTMVYVTHDQVEAMTMGERIVVMKDGLIQQIDNPLQLYSSPKNRFVAGFIGSPPMNFIETKLLDEQGGYWFDEGNFKVKLADDLKEKVKEYVGSTVFFGIRPEDIYDKLFYKESTPESIVKLNVKVVEPLGSEVLVYFSTGKNDLVARLDPKTELTINQDIEMVFDMSKIHLFDIKDGKIIL
jgi:multiple sugar transport system ATP-binding protein